MPTFNLTHRLRRDQRGQTSAEYMGVILIVAAILAAVLLSGVGSSITEKIEVTLCRIAGSDCGDSGSSGVACPVRTTTSTDQLSVGLSVKYFSGGGEGERVVIKEEFADGTARYTVVDKAALEVALGDPRGGGAGILGVGGSLTAGLAAVGALENADIYETQTPEQTADIDEALANSDGVEGALRGAENALDPVQSLLGAVTPGGSALSRVDVDGWLFDQVFGDADLPEPTSEYVGAEGGVDLAAGGSYDEGTQEAGAQAEAQVALGGRHFTSGERDGETEMYYRIEGSAAAELKADVLGEANAGASGELIVTVVFDESGNPITLRVNGTGTATALDELGETAVGPSEEDLRELLVDSDESSGRSVEFTAELDLTDEENLAPVRDLLSTNPLDQLDGARDLVPQLARAADVQYGIYDTELREDTTNTDVVVASLSTEDRTQVNTLRSLHHKPSGSTNFEEVDCDG